MKQKRAASSDQKFRLSLLQRALLAASCASFVAPALAQTPPENAANPAASPSDNKPVASAPPQEQAQDDAVRLDEFVVSGVRASIRSSIQRKRDETVLADILSSEDIGDLPALSIGEAIETITGAATHREKGGASEISIRGLGPFLGSASFNGREATNGSGDRSVNFNQFPSELVNEVAIYKTQRADFIEGGVAGTINMGTIKPLEYGKQLIQIEGRGIYSGDQHKRNASAWQGDDDIGWRGTVSYLDQFDLAGGGKLGVSFGVQSLETTNPEEVNSNSTTWVACDSTRVVAATANCNATPVLTAQQIAAGTPYYLVPGSRTVRQIIDSDKRDALFGAVQWRVNDAFDIDFDVQSSKRVYTEDRADLNLSETLRGLGNRVVSDNGTLLSYTGNSTVESTATFRIRDEQYTGGGVAMEWRPSSAWTLATDLSYSRTERSEMDRQVRLRSNATDINGLAVPGITSGQRVNYTFNTTGDIPTITLDPLFNLRNHDNYSAAARARRDENIRENEIRAARFDATFTPESGLFSAIKSGVRFSELTYVDSDDRVEINVTTAATIRDANLRCRIDFTTDEFLDGISGSGINSWAQFDPRCLFTAIAGVNDTGQSGNSATLLGSRDVTEKVNAAYVMGEFGSVLFGLPVSGNIGTRFVRTDVQSIGKRGGLDVVNNPDGSIRLVGTGQVESLSIDADNSVFLPSFNAVFALNEQNLLRLGLFRAMSRPDPSSLGAGRTFNLESGTSFTTVDDAIASITANGNPRIQPLLSWNADISYEWYPNDDSILSAAVYYKQFNGGFRPTVVNETYVIDGVEVVVPVLQDDTTDEKSDLFGVELTAAHRFSYLPQPFDGLGFKLGYNYADSNFKTEDLRLGEALNPLTGTITPRIVEPAGIFGLSEHVFSGSLYYEIGPLELQTIYKYRSEYYQKFVGAPSQNRYIRDTGVVDFRASFRVNEQLSLSLEGSNLNDEPRYQDMPIPGSFREINVYGPRYYFGVRYRF